jgi:predicted nucleotidyltransferase
MLAACGQQLEVRAVAARAPAARPTSVRAQLGPQARELRRHRRAVLDAARARGLRKVRVFGSLARGEPGPTSDIDLLVDLEHDRTLLDLAAFRREAEAILGVPVDVATPDMLKDRIRAQVMMEAVPL